MTIIHKGATAEVDGMEFVLSDATVDRYGDIVEPGGWDLRDFKKNPIALFGHDNAFPIGTWANVRVEAGKLKAVLRMATDGTSARIDELRRLIEQGILRAVSVGFRPLDAEPMDPARPYGPQRFKKQQLLECSVVSVPANPAALAVARSLSISEDTLHLAFGEQAGTGEGVVRRGATGVKAATTTIKSMRTNMTTLSKRIEDAQAALVKAQDDAGTISSSDDATADVIADAAADVEQKTAALAALQRLEVAMMAKAAPVVTDAPRVPAAVAKKSEPKDMVVRALAVKVLSHIEKRAPMEILQTRYGADENVKAAYDVVTKAASAPATTTTSGWADTLVQTAVYEFLDTLMPMSAYPRLREAGGKFTFGRNGIISLPARNTGTSIAGSFVAQGAPIPVRQAAFTAATLTPKKMAVITTFTREIAEHSTPDLEAALRQAIQEDTAVAIDTILMDNTAASTTRPAGLKNGVTGLTATSGGGFAALVADLKALVGALITGSGGNLRKPMFILNPVQALAISMTQNAGGDFPFAAGIERGSIQGYPVILSTTVAAGTVFLVDAADFFSATGDEPRFDVSDQATLHMEDTTPAAIGAAGTPNVVAAPVRSLFQTDTIGLRMIMDLNWTMRRTGTVAFVTSVTW